ncbi:MAG TPA: sigma-70 family RNA polymerase sigma factor, partial [Edaphobacter sp.]|nr:sigma-70 family RNA polymerase sigma factor [Edaphobacter sp.]
MAPAAAPSAHEFIKADVFNRELTNMLLNRNGAGQANAAAVEYIDGLYSYALVLTRNRPEAEDLVQETYVRAIQAKGRLRPGSSMKGWLFTILRNIWLNQLREWRNASQMVEIGDGDGVASSIVEPSKDSYDHHVGRKETEQFRAAIRELPLAFREIILLREYENFSYQEVASVLDCPVGTVTSQLGRARAK